MAKNTRILGRFFVSHRDWIITLWVLVAIVLFGFVLRSLNLLSLPIFADEAIYIRWAQVMKSESTLRFLPLSDGKQPLFMWVTIPFLKVFSDPLIAGRMVSVLTGVGGIIGIFILVVLLFGSKTKGLIASFLFAISPFSLFFNRTALVDSMLLSFGIWSLVFGVILAKAIRLDFAMLAGFALGGAWLTKSPAVFFLLLLPTTILVSGLTIKKENIWRFLKIFLLWIVSWGIASAMYNILRLGPNFHMVALRNKDYVFSFQEVLAHPFDPLQFHLQEIVAWNWVLLPGTTLVFAIVSLFLRGYFLEKLLLLAWTIFPLLVQAEFAKVFTARYILFTIFPLFVLASLSLEKLLQKAVWIKISSLTLVTLSALWIDYLLIFMPQKAPLPKSERSGYLEKWTAGTGIREVAIYLKSEHESEPGTQIVVGTEGYFGTLPDGLVIYTTSVPGVVVKGVGVAISSVNESLIEAKRAGNKVYLVVNSSRFEGKPENLGLRLLSSYPKAKSPDGTQESLLFFEVEKEAIAIHNIRNGKKEE